MKTQEKTLLKQQEVLGGFDSENYQSERLFANAPDGTEVPISVVYRKGMVKNGDNPLLLYGYGSYGANMEPYFSFCSIEFAGQRICLCDCTHSRGRRNGALLV